MKKEWIEPALEVMQVYSGTSTYNVEGAWDGSRTS